MYVDNFFWSLKNDVIIDILNHLLVYLYAS